MRKLIASAVVAVFCAAGTPSYAQFGAVKDGVKKAGEATVDGAKKAGEATADGVKKTGEVTGDTAKKGAEATAKGTKKVGKAAVQTTYRCNDGTTDKAAVKKDACRENGGVKAAQKAKPTY
jgi:hypothetical protein